MKRKSTPQERLRNSLDSVTEHFTNETQGQELTDIELICLEMMLNSDLFKNCNSETQDKAIAAQLNRVTAAIHIERVKRELPNLWVKNHFEISI